MASIAGLLDQLTMGLQDMNVARHMLAAAVTIMAYDWLLSLSTEIKYLWPARWSIVKVIFLVNRYLVPFLIIFALYGWSGHALWMSPRDCKFWVTSDSFILLAFFATLHYIVSLRAWALWGRSKMIGIIIWGSFVTYLAVTYTVTAKVMLAIDSAIIPVVNVCFGVLPSFLWVIWLPSIFYESLVFLLTAIKAVQHHRRRIETPILTVLYRDGFLYFVFIAMNSLANLLFWVIASPTKVVVLKYMTSALCQVAGSHLVLDLLAIGHKSGQSLLSGPRDSRRPAGSNQGNAFELRPSQGSRRRPDDNPWSSPEEWRVAGRREFEHSIQSEDTPIDERPYPFTRAEHSYPPVNIINPRTIQWSDQNRSVSEH